MEQIHELETLIEKGITAINQGKSDIALAYFNRAATIAKTPTVCSYLAYCLASAKGRVNTAGKICQDAIQRDPRNSTHYLNLGRILLLAGDKQQAIKVFRHGLKLSKDRQIITELRSLGLRQDAIIKSLNRRHPLNKYSGLLLSRLTRK